MLETASALALGFGLLALWGTARHRARERTWARFAAVVDEHLSVLVRKRRQLVRVDDYGVVDRSRWEREIGYFFDKVVFQALAPADLGRVEKRLNEFRERLEHMVETGLGDPGAEARFERVRNGTEFEQFCAEQLRQGGWKVTATGASRDQGADLIAERGRERLVVQCKFLGRPVGNYAVQEVVAARSHHFGNAALVASNQRFTASAAELAATNGVELCHWSELARL